MELSVPRGVLLIRRNTRQFSGERWTLCSVPLSWNAPIRTMRVSNTLELFVARKKSSIPIRTSQRRKACRFYQPIQPCSRDGLGTIPPDIPEVTATPFGRSHIHCSQTDPIHRQNCGLARMGMIPARLHPLNPVQASQAVPCTEILLHCRHLVIAALATSRESSDQR